MNGKHPLSDSWLYWDAERLDDFPHADDRNGIAAGTHGGVGDEAEASPRAGLLEELTLYVAGVSAAVAGVAGAALIGSFLSAYADLDREPAAERAAPAALAVESPAQRAARQRRREIVVESGTVAPAGAGGTLPGVGGGDPAKRSGT